ncbi:hypothetical protein F5887DRAFT_577257 [Amanita rubescens]|nr:hypothetical protein F5887DRAFT_577257 [Amanita rubescens]
MVLKALFGSLLALFICRAVALDLSDSYWIWKENTEVVPSYDVGDFRYDLVTESEAGPYAVSADILIAADNNYTLWVNGIQVGTGTNWGQAQGYCVQLYHYYNVFAVEVVSAHEPPGSINPAALIAAIEVTFTDGSTQTIVSDDTWLANNSTSGFESIFYDDSSWPTAYELATADTSPWNTPASPPSPSSLSLASSQWIWTDEISGPGGDAPVGNRTFRKDISIAGRVPATGGTIIISTDNAYTLYINGQEIGSYDNWEIAQSWTFTLDTPSRNIIVAVNAENMGGPAGVIAALDLTCRKRVLLRLCQLCHGQQLGVQFNRACRLPVFQLLR